MGDHDDVAGEGGACDESSAAEGTCVGHEKKGVVHNSF